MVYHKNCPVYGVYLVQFSFELMMLLIFIFEFKMLQILTSNSVHGKFQGELFLLLVLLVV